MPPIAYPRIFGLGMPSEPRSEVLDELEVLPMTVAPSPASHARSTTLRKAGELVRQFDVKTYEGLKHCVMAICSGTNIVLVYCFDTFWRPGGVLDFPAGD